MDTDSNQAASGQMSPVMAMIFLFNLIVGTGALALPSAFANCGWLVSTVVIGIICLTSYVTTTFIIESMSIANAIAKLTRRRLVKPEMDSSSIDNDDSSRQMVTGFLNEEDPLLDNSTATDSSNVQRDFEEEFKQLFDITQLIECGRLARLFFSKKGATLFYICLCIYLYGDLTIYSVAISKSFTDLICDVNSTNTVNSTVGQSCWPTSPLHSDISRIFVYRLSVLAVLLGCGSFAFFNVQKTKYLQIFTSLYRWFAFSTMIILAIIVLAKGKGEGKPQAANLSGIPSLFGVSIYAFMCHHSIPSLITPIKDKSSIFKYILSDYILILAFYLLLSLTGLFTFTSLKDVYTLNFLSHPIDNIPVIIELLPIFPILVLSTNFPILAITLSNNLRVLMNTTTSARSLMDTIIVPLIAILPPIALSILTDDLVGLIGIVGSYFGLFIQWLIPALLVQSARQQVSSSIIRRHNHLSSPFASKWWTYLIIVWSLACLLFITIDRYIIYRQQS